MYSTVPPELVASLLKSHPATRDELGAIRDRRNPDRFQGVYSHVHGGRFAVNSYRARVFKFFELGSGFATAEDAARAVVAFYKAHYGDRWRRVFAHRKVTPWRLRAVRRRPDPTPVGFAVDVYLRGNPVGVTHADAHGRSPGASERFLWPTPAAAKCAARAAMRKWFEREVRALAVPAPGLLFWRA